MMNKRFELRLCSDGTYYVYENGKLVIDNISFDKFNKDNANVLIDLLNEYYDKIISLETEMDFLQMENNEIKYVLKNIRQIELKR